MNSTKYSIRQIWKERLTSAEKNWDYIRNQEKTDKQGKVEEKVEEEKNNDEIVIMETQTKTQNKKGKKKNATVTPITPQAVEVQDKKNDQEEKQNIISLSYSTFNPNKNNIVETQNAEPEIRLSYMRSVKKTMTFNYASNSKSTLKNSIHITKFNKGFERDFY